LTMNDVGCRRRSDVSHGSSYEAPQGDLRYEPSSSPIIELVDVNDDRSGVNGARAPRAKPAQVSSRAIRYHRVSDTRYDVRHSGASGHRLPNTDPVRRAPGEAGESLTRHAASAAERGGNRRRGRDPAGGVRRATWNVRNWSAQGKASSSHLSKKRSMRGVGTDATSSDVV